MACKYIDRKETRQLPPLNSKKYDLQTIADKLETYIQSTDNPSVAEFCSDFSNPVKDTLYNYAKEYKPISDSLKRINAIQEARTIRMLESGELNPIYGIFKLKQPAYGWTDKQQVESINLNIDADLSENDADRILKSAGLRLETEQRQQLQQIDDDE